MDYKKVEAHTKIFGKEICTKPIQWIAGKPLHIMGNLIDLKSAKSTCKEKSKNNDYSEFAKLLPYAINIHLENESRIFRVDKFKRDIPEITVGYCYDELSQQKIITFSDLPIEFFNHQLMKVDCENEQSVYEFVTEWGFPYSLCRSTSDVFKRGFYSLDRYLRDCNSYAIEETNEIENLFKTKYEYIKIISLFEVSQSIVLLQNIVQSIADYIEEKPNNKKPLIEALNMGICYPYTADYGKSKKSNSVDLTAPSNDLHEHGYLTSAICNQIIVTIQDDIPWRRCACTDCKKVFKRKQSKSKRPNSNAFYCSDKCEERQKKRNQSKAAKNRIVH